jgi:hypothetical protein
MRIVLNFGILKIPLPIPTRSDQYNAGPVEVSLTKTAITKMGISKTETKQRQRNRSKILFRKLWGHDLNSPEFGIVSPQFPKALRIPASLLSSHPKQSLNHTGVQNRFLFE